MSVSSSNLVVYTAWFMPEDNSSTAGGGINSGIRATFEDPTTPATIKFTSTSSSDSQDILLTGRSSEGAIISETVTMPGVADTPVTSSNTYERILKCIVDTTAAVGTITVSGTSEDEKVTDIPPEESGFRRPFYDATADAVSTETYYEKIFVMNTNSSSTLNNATLKEISNGLYNKVDFGLESTKNNIASVINRSTAPGNVPYGYGTGPSGMGDPATLAALDYQGVWLKMDLAAAEPAQNSFYEVQISGTTA